MPDDIKTIIQETAKETAKVVSQDLGVAFEGIQSDVQHIVEAVDTHTRQLQRLAPIEETLDQLKTDMGVVKTTLEQVNLAGANQKGLVTSVFDGED